MQAPITFLKKSIHIMQWEIKLTTGVKHDLLTNSMKPRLLQQEAELDRGGPRAGQGWGANVPGKALGAAIPGCTFCCLCSALRCSPAAWPGLQLSVPQGVGASRAGSGARTESRVQESGRLLG